MINKIYFVGIKGVGMTGLAIYCKEKGYIVEGSDTEEKFSTDNILNKYSIKVYQGFKKENIISSKPSLVIYSGAYDINKNEETLEAINIGIKLISHGEALGQFMNGKIGISVAGTHGKTTSTALIATILMNNGLDPSYLIGASEVFSLNSPGHFGKGKYFIAEADEYQTAVNNIKRARFLWQNPKYLLLTNIDFDHPDVYKNISEVKEAFKMLVKKIPKDGIVVYNGDDSNCREVIMTASCKTISFGASSDNKYRIKDIIYSEGGTHSLVKYSDKTAELNLKIIGRHNCINALGVFAICKSVGISDSSIIKEIEKFSGSKRRFEKIAFKNGIYYYDDYAHHPTEVSETLKAVKKKFPKNRIVLIFQPHTFSRTQALLDGFKTCFKNADVLILSSIFSSARENSGNFSINSEKLAESVRIHNKSVYYEPNNKRMVEYVRSIVKKGDLVLTMGAGDIYKLHKLLI